MSNSKSYLLLPFAEFPPPRIICSEERHYTIDNLLFNVNDFNNIRQKWITRSLKSLSSAKRVEHSLINSICKKMCEVRYATTLNVWQTWCSLLKARAKKDKLAQTLLGCIANHIICFQEPYFRPLQIFLQSTWYDLGGMYLCIKGYVKSHNFKIGLLRVYLQYQYKQPSRIVLEL